MVEAKPGVAELPVAVPWHTLTSEEVSRWEAVDVERGLTTAEAARRRESVGPNRLADAPPEPFWHAFIRQYKDPMQIVLVAAGIGSFYPVKQYGTAVLLLFLTVFNAALGLRQEGKAASEVAALAKMMVIKNRVRRDGELQELAAEDLVPGDVVAIEAGDIVPADGRLIRAATLEVDESALTGESLPVGKSVDPVEGKEIPLGDRSDMVYMHTNVTRGSGLMLVTETGMATEVGHISSLLSRAAEGTTPLTRQLEKLTTQILVIAGVAVAISFSVNLARGGTFHVVFTAAVAFAIAAVPTGLPAVVTAILSYGTQQLAKVGAIMKRLRSTETLGSTTAINSDKTGTLTLNQMTAVEMVLLDRRYSVSGNGYSTEGRLTRVAGQEESDLDPFLMPMVLASDAVVQDGKVLGDPTEGALVVLAVKGGIDVDTTRRAYPRVAEVPFDAAYKLMATFHEMGDEHGRKVVRCFVKGAPDQLLERAYSVLGSDLVARRADDSLRERYMTANQRLGASGLRVMATAYRDFDPSSFDPGADLLPLVNGLTLLSLVGIVDPPRVEAKEAIATAKAAGIRIRMITGDHAVTAEAIAGQLGIEGEAITGADFSLLSDEEAAARIDRIGVLARVTPEHKSRLIDVLKAQDNVVAMTGDGVNDAPALKRADIGIAMGITGTEVAKEAAVMILTDDNFATIVRAVELGRGLYDKLTKYVRFQVGCLFGYITAFLGASLFNVAGGIPLLPLQTLWINFTVQLSQAIGLGYGKAAEGLMGRAPRPVDEPILSRERLTWLGTVGLIMGGGTLIVVSLASSGYNHEVGRTMGLVTFSLFDLFWSFEARDETHSAFTTDLLEDRTFLRSSALSFVAIWLSTNLGPLQRLLGTTDLNRGQWLICAGVASAVIVVAEVVKAWQARRKGAATS